MPLVLTYLDADTQEIVEDFVAFVECEHGITVAAAGPAAATEESAPVFAKRSGC